MDEQGDSGTASTDADRGTVRKRAVERLDIGLIR